MNSRIYLQPDAIPNQDEIRTANRLFRHFGKEVTFLQKSDEEVSADITMNRLRWSLVNPVKEADFSEKFAEASAKAGNLIFDLALYKDDLQKLQISLQELFINDDEVANLVIIKKDESVEEFSKEDQAKAKRK